MSEAKTLAQNGVKEIILVAESIGILGLRLALDIDLVSGQTGGKSRVLSLLADSKRELVIVYDNAAGACFLVSINRDNVCRSKSSSNILCRILTVFFVVNLSVSLQS
mgnify:CR=1 FL=1